MNLHTLGNRDEENQNRGNRQPLVGGNNGIPNMGFGNMNNQNHDPRNESFIQMIHINFCPSAIFKSFVVYISLLLLVIYIIQLSVGRLFPLNQYPLATVILTKKA
jgi:hypothetical protein